jgi:hypothetical protein
MAKPAGKKGRREAINMNKKMAYAALALLLVAGVATAEGSKRSVKKPAKKPAKVVFVDFARDATQGSVFGDEGKGCKGEFSVRDGKGVVAVKACDGWGEGLYIPKSTDNVPVNATGATKIVWKMRMPVGVKVTMSVNETGCAPKENAFTVSPEGADGERFNGAEWQGTGQTKSYTANLADLKLNEGYGNQAGNKRLDLKGIDSVEIFIPGVAVAGEIEIASITFE